MSDVLSVRGLNVTVRDKTLVSDVDLTVGPGERVGLIGESGSGKSLTALSVLGLLPEDVIASGSVRLTGVDHELIDADERRMSRIRGLRLSMVFQEPMTALNPTMRIGDQIAEAMLIHRTQPSRGAARAAAAELLERVQLPVDTLRAYPHQLSGGQRQRVVLALALANDPALLICDEPTTALDVTVQALVLDLIVKGVVARSSALLFITHDLAVVATVCERVLVMYGGRVVESGPVGEVFTRPRHRYTEGLLAASDLETADRRLTTIPGNVPPAGQFPSGCVFRTRCRYATDVCATTPSWSGTEASGFACHHPAGNAHDPASTTQRAAGDDSTHPASATQRAARDDSAEPASATQRAARDDSAEPASATQRAARDDSAEPASATQRPAGDDSAHPASATQRPAGDAHA